MSTSKAEFLQAGVAELSAYPNIAQLARAQDPRVMAQIAVNAAMLAMLSSQIDVAMYEPFQKSRDGTVMADAAMKSILPLGRAARVTLQIENRTDVPVSLIARRRLLDQSGRLYELDAAVEIPADDVATVTAQNIRRRTIDHAVDGARAFYRIPINSVDDGLYLSDITVSKGADTFAHAPDWFNVQPDDLAYQIEVDELRAMYVMLGKDGVVGYGARQGDRFVLSITECNGRVTDLRVDSVFNLEYVNNSAETGLGIKLVSVDDEGASPHSVDELRVMARYPAIYDHNAVYLGEFAFLVRRYTSGVRFLSVWNEQTEERVRGASEDNINKLFVSGLVSGMTNPVFEERASRVIRRADDSYRIQFVPAVMYPVPVTITASIAISWDLARVEAQIRALVLSVYGDGAQNVSVGMVAPKKRDINDLLAGRNKQNPTRIDALMDEKAEFDVSMTLPAVILPEHFLYISPDSLTVTLSSAGYSTGLWGS